MNQSPSEKELRKLQVEVLLSAKKLCDGTPEDFQFDLSSLRKAVKELVAFTNSGKI